jgi:hypothetical protein
MFPSAVLSAVAHAAIPSDRVASLPGWPGELPSKHYSGLIPVGNKTGSPGHLHYWLIESERSTQATDPLVVWYNGGPGSSSLIGLLTENGQLQLNDASLNVTKGSPPGLFYNPHSWSTVANVLYLEQPKGVGFSYCDDGTDGDDAAAKCVNTDESTAIDGHEFLVNWFKAFPEYASNDFFITGESYAGLYIPMLMDEIDTHGDIPNFKGAMIGNGCWGSDCFYGMSEPEIDYHIFQGHAMIPYPLKLDIDTTCTNFESPSAACAKLLEEAENLPGAFNVYNIYDVCNGDSLAKDPDALAAALREANATTRHGAIRAKLRESSVTVDGRAAALRPHPALSGALNDFACGGQNAMDVWLGLDAVQKALHVNGHPRNSMRYDKTAGDITSTYVKLMKKYQLLIYSGDVDACVPYWGTEKFTRSIGGVAKKAWHAWHSNSAEDKGSVVAGYALAYEDFQVVTVKGAGHMVPTFKVRIPDAALTRARPIARATYLAFPCALRTRALTPSRLFLPPLARRTLRFVVLRYSAARVCAQPLQEVPCWRRILSEMVQHVLV